MAASDNEMRMRQQLNDGSLHLCSASDFGYTSTAYVKFTLLVDSLNKYQQYVQCMECKKLIKHDMHKSGTTHLSRHSEAHAADKATEPPRKQRKVTEFVKRKTILSAQDKASLHSAMGYFCARDIRPFSAVDGPGFKQLAQQFINIGKKYGNVEVSDVLPSRTTVSELCAVETKQCRQDLVARINEFCNSHGILGITTDMWQEEYKKKNFVAITVHMIEKEVMVSRVLQVYQFPYDEQKTAENIRASLHKITDALGINDMTQHFYYVTDEGANIKAALNSKYRRIACSCHCLSTGLKHALPGGPGDKGDTEELQALDKVIDEVKKLVRYVKKSGLNAALSKTVLQENETRWNSLLMMIDSVIDQEVDLKRKLQEANEYGRIETIDFCLLKMFREFLQPLKQATKALESDKYPTIHRVVLWHFRLVQHATPLPFDSPIIKQLKQRLAEALPRKWELTTVHKLALFLHPEYKSLRRLSAADKLDVYSMARSFVAALQRRDLQLQEAALQKPAETANT